MEKLRLIELFAGYGSQAMALKRAGVPFTHYKVVEFDKYAIASYNAVHGTNFPTMDITKVHAQDLEIVDTDKYKYLLTYSFPCTDLSVAGKMEGMSKGSGTRSGLLWEVERILEECKDNLPQFLLMENVTQVHGEQNIADFTEWIRYLSTKGYKSKWQDLNAKDYGIPQNRDRCFMVSYLDKKTRFEFPLPFKLSKFLKDYLESDIDDKYYLSERSTKRIIRALEKDHSPNFIDDKEICYTIDTRVGAEGNYSQYIRNYIPIRNGTKKGYIEAYSGDYVNLQYDTSDSRRGRVGKGCIHTLCCNDRQGVVTDNLKIRKLTPLECYRLMGVTDEDALKMIRINPISQCYKQAGNSIVVDVMVEIFKNLFLGGSYNIPSQMDIDDLLTQL